MPHWTNIRTKMIVLAILVFLLFLPSLALADMGSVDDALVAINGFLFGIIFFDIWPFDNSSGDKIVIPFMIIWLSFGALYFTFRFKFVNFRLFFHAIDCVRGKFSKPGDDTVGEVTHFQALTMALSATVGLGNIAGVAIAVSIGGPGATFWMILAGILGMSSKFVECTLAQIYREVRSDGHIMGGAMEYCSRGLKDIGRPKLGKFLAILFCVACVGASIGGGNAFQVSQALGAVQQNVSFFDGYPWVFGLIMAFLVGIVIIGGVKRIAQTAAKLVPVMVVIYVAACLWVIMTHFTEIPAAFSTIISSAFSFEAGIGGFIGVLVMGFKRASFSNEAGLGSAAIAHSAAKTPYPVREGIVALLEPFIDTVVICTMTALVIVITGAYSNPELAHLVEAKNGAALTGEAFRGVISWFPILLSACVILFAYSTMISWSYYGERCWTYMFGEKYSMGYRVMFLVFIILGTLGSPSSVLDFSDVLFFTMAFPNLIALYLLQGKVRDALNEYMVKLKNGEFKPLRFN